MRRLTVLPLALLALLVLAPSSLAQEIPEPGVPEEPAPTPKPVAKGGKLTLSFRNGRRPGVLPSSPYRCPEIARLFCRRDASPDRAPARAPCAARVGPVVACAGDPGAGRARGSGPDAQAGREGRQADAQLPQRPPPRG